jgi:hypothetical protein
MEGGVTKREHTEFMAAKRVIERVHRRLGIKREYLARDWVRDEQFLRDSARRKRELRRQEAELIAVFESSQHGRPVLAEPPELSQEERRAS